MTPAVATPSSDSPRSTQTVPIVILGTDALLAAQPATPVQLAHACLRAGFSNAIPASWGDELIAAAVLKRLPQFDGGPAIQCSCPIVAHRLLSVGGDLRPAMLGLVAPPVAIARYVRALSGATPVRITYVGGCPGAIDDAIDIRMRPDALLALLAERDIVIEDEPRVFESVLPPDRRRFRSQPGGVPTAESLWSDVGARTLVEMDTEDFVTELAQQLLTGKNVLIDAGPHLGCVCSGAVAGVAVKDARAGVVTLEPPRAMMPVVEEQAPIDLELAVPAASRTPVDISAVVTRLSPPRGMQAIVTVPAPSNATTAQPLPAPLNGHRFSPVRSMPAIPESKVPTRTSGPSALRSVLGQAPVARDADGKSLPRAYVARRRPSPRNVTAVKSATPAHPEPEQKSLRATRSSGEAPRQEAPPQMEDVTARPATQTEPSKSAHTETHVVAAPVAAPAPFEQSRYEPPKHTPAVAPEPITFFEKVATPPASAARTSRETVARETPSRDGREAHTLSANPTGEKTRAPSRPRPSVFDLDPRTGMSTRRLILVLAGITVLVGAVMSLITGIVVTRVVRSSETPTAASVTPPSTKP